MFLKKVLLGALIVLGLASGQANAATIHWTLHNGIFNDDGTVAGSFFWDTDLKTVTSWNFVVAGGNVGSYPPATYPDDIPNF